MYIVTPAPGVDTTNFDMVQWRKKMVEEFAKWKADPNYIIIAPFAIMMTKVGDEDGFVVKESFMPVKEAGYGLRIISGGTPDTTLVMTHDGHALGMIDKMEFLPIDSTKDEPLRVRLTMPVGYMDVRAEQLPPAGG